jgi:5-methylcytosine-specific restriction endonuclease McrA
MTMLKACPTCGAISCGTHARKNTGRGSTRAWRKLRAQVLKRDRHTCRWCGAPATHADHLVPVSKGGPDTLANVVASCATCNQRRGNRPAP